MQSLNYPGGRPRSWPSGKHIMVISTALLAMFISGCGSYSPVKGLPSSNASRAERCPLGQARICQVAWPSRLDRGNRGTSCRCR
jgi:hypothetical protein